MSETVREWVDKSEGDYRTAVREFDVTDYPNYDAVCFHAQQCVEKLMKAVLMSRNVVPPRTHALVVLDELVRSVVPMWSWPLADLRLLDRAAVTFRYPGESADKEEAEDALRAAAALRDKLTELLNGGS